MKGLLLFLALVALNDFGYGFKLDYLANVDSSLYNRNLEDYLYQQISGSNEISEPHEKRERLSQDYFDTDPQYYDDYEIKEEHHRNEELSDGSMGKGYQYIQGGAGEGEQNLKPDGSKHNKNDMKSDEELPAYCNPPNPCPAGYTGSYADCDQTPVNGFTAQFSKKFQESQDCACDEDHNDCSKYKKKKTGDEFRELIRKDVSCASCRNLNLKE